MFYSETLVLLISIAALFHGADRFEWKQGQQIYSIVEGRRLIRLVQLQLMRTNNPLQTSVTILLEPCGGMAVADHGDVPCWPETAQDRTQSLLAKLYWNMPDYRKVPRLLHAARYLNRDVGTFRVAWIVGIDPLTTAFLDGPPDNVPPDVQQRIEQVRKLVSPTTRPGVFEIVTASGDVVSMDLRVRDARLVTEADLEAHADVVLLFPKGLVLTSGEVLKDGETVEPPPRAKVLYLRAPQSLKSIMRGLTEAGALENEATKVLNVPISVQP